MKDRNDGTLKKTISGPIFTAQFLEKHGFGTCCFFFGTPSLASPSGFLAGTMTAIPCERKVMPARTSSAAVWPGARGNSKGDVMRYYMR